MSRVWLGVDTGQCLRTNYIRNISMHLFFMVTLLDRFYSLKFTDETMKPLGPYVVDPELKPGFLSPVSKVLLLKVFGHCSVCACLLLKQKHDFNTVCLAKLKLPDLHKDCV